MTALRSFTRQSIVLMASEVVMQLKAFLVLPLVTKLFGAVSYGIWSQVEVLQSLLVPLVIMGLDSAVMRFAPGQTSKDIGRSLSSVLAYNVVVAVALGLILWFMAKPLAAAFFGGEGNAIYVALCIPALLASVLLSLSRAFFLVLGSATTVAAMRVAEGALLLAPLLWVLLTNADFFKLVIGNISVVAGLGLICLVLIWRTIPLCWPDFLLLRRYLRYGIASMPAGYAMWMINLSDRFFLSSFRGVAEVGVYASVYSLAYIVISLFFNPFWALYPVQAAKLYNAGRLDDLRSLFRHSTRMATLLVIPGTVGLAVLGPSILDVMTTPEFITGAKILPIISLAYAISMYGAYFSINLGLIHKPHVSTLAIFAAAGCNVVLNFLLIPKVGILGAAISTLLSFVLQFVIEWHFSRRLFMARMGFDGPGLAKVVAGSLCMALILVACGFNEPGGPWALACSVILGATVYAVSQVLLRTISGDELRQLCDSMLLSSLSKRFPICALASYLDKTR